jgi:hypothetical protein
MIVSPKRLIERRTGSECLTRIGFAAECAMTQSYLYGVTGVVHYFGLYDALDLVLSSCTNERAKAQHRD